MKAIVYGNSHARHIKAWNVFSKGGRIVQTCHLDVDWENFLATCQEAERVVVLLGSNDVEPWLRVSPTPKHAGQAVLQQLHWVQAAT